MELTIKINQHGFLAGDAFDLCPIHTYADDVATLSCSDFAIVGLFSVFLFHG
jgi:hypothetical protein